MAGYPSVPAEAGSRGVDDHDVCAVGEVPGPELGEVAVLLVEHGDGATFGGDMEAVQSGS